MHVILLIYNFTTIDQIEKRQDKKEQVKYNIFYLGFYRNITEVLGCFFLWFIPVGYNNEYNGYQFEINKEIYNTISNLNKTTK
jgi:hypothetical protein